MKIAAIITEYNPFHYGHLYQIEKTREILGDDTAVIAIMSGNFVQRGEPSIADKTVRAEVAIECGVNLVLELPFPYSMSSAEFFARAGVYIAEKIGVVDYLVFGSEIGDADSLRRISDNMLLPEYKSAIEALQDSKEHVTLGYPELCELAYNSVFSDNIPRSFFSSNNILALEYLKALSALKSDIKPLTIKRTGADYNDKKISDSRIQSASAIRELANSDLNSALNFIPDSAKNVFYSANKSGKFPTDVSRLDTAVISNFRLNPTAPSDIHDVAGGLYNRLYDASIKANSISSLTSMTSTKKFTQARIRRAIWYSFFGITSSDVRANPAYVQVLAMDLLGRSILKRIKKMCDLPLITKPSAYKELGDEVVRQKELSRKVDSVFTLTMDLPNSGDFPLTFTPYVKK